MQKGTYRSCCAPPRFSRTQLKRKKQRQGKRPDGSPSSFGEPLTQALQIVVGHRYSHPRAPDGAVRARYVVSHAESLRARRGSHKSSTADDTGGSAMRAVQYIDNTHTPAGDSAPPPHQFLKEKVQHVWIRNRKHIDQTNPSKHASSKKNRHKN